MIVTIEWEHVERLSNKLEVPDDASPKLILELASIEACKGRAGKMDTILSSAVGRVRWEAADGRFGGQIQ